MKKIILHLMGVAALSYIWRLLELGQAGFTWGEIIYYRAGILYLAGFKGCNVENPPFIKYLIGIFLMLGRGEFWARLPVAILGSIIPVIVFYLAKALYEDVYTALLAAIIVSQEVNLIGYSRLAAPDAPATLFTLLAILYYFRYASNGKLSSLAALALTIGLGLLTKYTAAMAAPLTIIYWILLNKVWKIKLHSILRLGMGLALGFGIYVGLSLLLGFNPTLTLTALMETYRESLKSFTPLATVEDLLVKPSPTYLALLALALPHVRREVGTYLAAASFITPTIIVLTLGVGGIRLLLTPLIFLSILIARGLIYSMNRSRLLLALAAAMLILHAYYPSIIHPYYISHVNPLYNLLGSPRLPDSDLGWGQILKESLKLIADNAGAFIITNYAPHLVEYYTGRGVYVVGYSSYGYNKISSVQEAFKVKATHLIIYKSDGVIWNYNEVIEDLIKNSRLMFTMRFGVEVVEVYILWSHES